MKPILNHLMEDIKKEMSRRDFGKILLKKLIDPLTRKQKIVAYTIYKEAGGEGKKGMYLVACVIKQRHIERDVDPYKICIQKYQFSVWKGKNPLSDDITLRPKNSIEKEAMNYAKQLALNIKNDSVDPAEAEYANGFFSGKKPKWIPDEYILFKYKGHTFWREPR